MPKQWWERITQEEAKSRLKELLDKKGELKIITAQHRCGCNEDGRDPRNPKELKICQEYKYVDRDPRHWVCHDVVGFTDANKQGWFTAVTKEGDRESTSDARYMLYRLTLHKDIEEFDEYYSTLQK